MPVSAPRANPLRSSAAFAARHRDRIVALARRYSIDAADAEDASQRALEILLTRGPDVPEDQLVRWLATVAKHEALAIRRARTRHLGPGDDPEAALAALPAPVGDPHAHAAARERLARLGEALRSLKPQERRALALRTRGLSYRQICAATGWTYTKVDRCLKEGRAALRAEVAA